jgi:hypothetical protein
VSAAEERQVFPPAWPWLRALTAEDLPYLLADLHEVTEAGPEGFVPELDRLAAEWADTIALRERGEGQ